MYLYYRIGILHCGDRLLSINGEKLIDKSLQEAKHLLNHSDITVKLEVMLANNFTDTDTGRLPVSPADDAISRVSSRCSQSVPVETQRRPSQCMYHCTCTCINKNAFEIDNLLSEC